MIFEHEIPKGSQLYFGKLAHAKRVLENQVCDILEECGFVRTSRTTIMGEILPYYKGYGLLVSIRFSQVETHGERRGSGYYTVHIQNE
jgi:hypothetical protein